MATAVAASKPHGLMFHHFYDERHVKGQGAISAEQLDAILRDYRHRLLPAQEWLDRALSDRLCEGDVCITFDDALRCQYEVALPVLEQHDLTGFWFVYSSVLDGGLEKLEIYRKFRTVYFSAADDFYRTFFAAVDQSRYADLVQEALVGYDHDNWRHFPFYTPGDTRFRYIRDTALGRDRYDEVMRQIMQTYHIDFEEFSADLWMEPQHVRDLCDRGHVIGLHSHSHPTDMGQRTPAEQRFEYETNFQFLRQLIGSAPVAASHPCNSYNDETISLLRSLGIQLGFRANMADHQFSMLEFPREDHANIVSNAIS